MAVLTTIALHMLPGQANALAPERPFGEGSYLYPLVEEQLRFAPAFGTGNVHSRIGGLGSVDIAARETAPLGTPEMPEVARHARQTAESRAPAKGARPEGPALQARPLAVRRVIKDKRGNSFKKSVISAGLETLYFSGAHRLMRPFVSGVGAILTFHHVRPRRADAFQPNSLLEITPDFFEQILRSLRADGIEIVSLEEVHRRLTAGDFQKRFVALTFDDGYRDNRDFAYPILKRYNAPFTVFVPSSFAEGTGNLWWLVLEKVVAKTDALSLTMNGAECWFDCSTLAAKVDTFETIYWWLRSVEDEGELRAVMADLADRHGVDIAEICTSACLGWDELAEFAKDPLVTIGAHTVNHIMLKKATDAEVRAEMEDGAARLEARLGFRPGHISFPIGDASCAGPREFRIAAELGFKTAVTTRPGVLFRDHSGHLTALPRISVNGGFQRLRYLDVLLSGTPTALINGFRRVDAA